MIVIIWRRAPTERGAGCSWSGGRHLRGDAEARIELFVFFGPKHALERPVVCADFPKGSNDLLRAHQTLGGGLVLDARIGIFLGHLS